MYQDSNKTVLIHVIDSHIPTHASMHVHMHAHTHTHTHCMGESIKCFYFYITLIVWTKEEVNLW